MTLGPEIDSFSPAENDPPRRLGRFFLWALSGSWPALIYATFWSAAAGVLDVISALIIGNVIDAALASEPATVFRDNWILFLGFALFYVTVRPITFAMSSATVNIVLGPNLLPLVLSRLHRWTMGHAVTFFDNDFAGRIAQKQMQTARAVTDVVTETINVVAFALASLFGSVAFLMGIDPRIALALAVWLVFYLLLIRLFLPSVRGRSAARHGP